MEKNKRKKLRKIYNIIFSVVGVILFISGSPSLGGSLFVIIITYNILKPIHSPEIKIIHGVEVFYRKTYNDSTCSILNRKFNEIYSLGKFWSSKDYSVPSILILNELGFKLTSPEDLELIQTDSTKSKVIKRWNSLMEKFDDYDLIIAELKGELTEEMVNENELKKEELKKQKEEEIKQNGEIVLKGRFKQLRILEDKVTFELQPGLRTGISARNSTNDVYFDKIRSIVVFDGSNQSLLLGGDADMQYFKIEIEGYQSPQNKVHDPYCIFFDNSSYIDEAKKVKKRIEGLMRDSKNNESSGINELEKLMDLKEKGIITQEEFDLKKKQILGL